METVACLSPPHPPPPQDWLALAWQLCHGKPWQNRFAQSLSDIFEHNSKMTVFLPPVISHCVLNLSIFNSIATTELTIINANWRQHKNIMLATVEGPFYVGAVTNYLFLGGDSLQFHRGTADPKLQTDPLNYWQVMRWNRTSCGASSIMP